MATDSDFAEPEIEKGAFPRVSESPASPITPSPPASDDNIHVTAKTWVVILVLSSTFGLSWWPVPATSALQGTLALKLGSPISAYWYVPAYTTANALGFLLSGANSDIFGRRIFLLTGNVICCVGHILSASAKGYMQFTAGLAIAGFGGGACQMAICSVPELIPNKFRHIGICLSEMFLFITVVVGPVVGRYAITKGDSWIYIFWGGFIAQFLSLVAIALCYFPPKHPRGVPWRDGIRGLDYVGAALVVPGICTVLVGIINTTYKKSSDVTVVAPMCVGFGLLVLFGFWETFSNVKYPLCPQRIFAANYGRSFTVPFILTFIVTMYYFCVNVIWGTMINVFYVTPTTSMSETLALTLPGNLGLVFGALLLACFGSLFGNWKWTLTAAWTGTVVWGGLLALVTPYNKGTMIAFTFLEQMFFGWAFYETVAFAQLGVHQHDLGMSGGLAGVARYAGGSLAQAIYTSILVNAQSTRAAATVPQAAIRAGLSASSAEQLLAAFPLGAAALQKIPGINEKILGAAATAYQWSYAHGLKITALSSLSFGVLGLVLCFFLEDIDKKMNNKTEVFLENDVNADKNEFH